MLCKEVNGTVSSWDVFVLDFLGRHEHSGASQSLKLRLKTKFLAYLD